MEIQSDKARVFEALAKGVVWEDREAVDNLRFLDTEKAAFEIVQYFDPEWSLDKLHLIEYDLEPERIAEIAAGAELTPEEDEIFYASLESASYESASLYRIVGADGQIAWAVMLRECSSMEEFDWEAYGPFDNREAAIASASQAARRWGRWSTDFELEGKEDLTSVFIAAIGSEPTEPYC